LSQQSRPYIVGALLALGLCAWIVVGGIIIVDTLIPPTPSNVPTTRPVALRNTEMATVNQTDIPTATTLPTSSPTVAATPTPPDVPDDIATESVGMLALATNVTAQGTAAATKCAPPDGWVAYTIEPGDTLFGFELGSKGQVNVAAIMQSNCLTSKLLAIGQVVYLPAGVADNSPKIEDIGLSSPTLPAGQTRVARCPCTLVIRAGWRLEQIAIAIDSVPVGFTGRDFLATVAAGAPVPALEFLGSLPTGKSLEGFMFPGTYTVENSTSAMQFRDMALNAFAANVGGQIQADAAARGLTFWQVIVMASIVQRESYAASEQKLIASVFYNRLAASKGLAATVTLQYALGRPGNWWPRVVGGTINTDSRYNTNIYPGLPPSPISNPGLEAIVAAVYPAQTEYQYFSGKCGGGGNFYARTFEEFRQGLQCNK
jgi:cell division protein YceG involved in septum cleavage